MHANGEIERGYPPVLPLASRGALVGATPLLVTGNELRLCHATRRGLMLFIHNHPFKCDAQRRPP